MGRQPAEQAGQMGTLPPPPRASLGRGLSLSLRPGKAGRKMWGGMWTGRPHPRGTGGETAVWGGGKARPSSGFLIPDALWETPPPGLTKRKGLKPPTQLGGDPRVWRLLQKTPCHWTGRGGEHRPPPVPLP